LSPNVKTSPPIESSNAAVATELRSHIAMSPAPTKICGPDGGWNGGGFVVGGPGVGPVGDWLPQYPQAMQRRTTRNRRITAIH
jgi:hypothetical protein